MTAIEDQLNRAHEEKLAQHSRENENLDECPLPEEIPDPLTRVYEIEKEIQHLNERITGLIHEKNEALDYAVRHDIREDPRCWLKESVRRSRTLDVARFREVFPQEWEMARQVEIKDLNERLAHAGEKVNLTLVDKLVKKPVLEAAPGVVTVTESRSYSVVRK